MTAPVIAVFDTSQDTVDLLRTALQRAGYVVVAAFTHDLRDGKVDLEAFLRQHSPVVAVYDVAIPYAENWRLFQHIRNSPACRHMRFVVTTTNVRRVARIAGPDERLHEIVGDKDDLDEVVRAVKDAVNERPVR